MNNRNRATASSILNLGVFLTPNVNAQNELTSELIQLPTTIKPIPSGIFSTINMDELEQIALANNQTPVQKADRIHALHGKQAHVGLCSNPELDYISDETGNKGTSGLQGGFLLQKIMTSRK
jgi:hypothetical protein